MPQAVMTLGAVAAIWFAATLTPGPDFMVTTRVAMVQGRAVARRTVGGLAVGTAVWGLAGFFGIHSVFIAAPYLYTALKIGGGAYLVFLGGRLLRASFAGTGDGVAAAAPSLGAGPAFRLGLLTNLANPKAALFTTSMFAATLPPAPPVWLGLAAAGIMTAICLGWYGFVAYMLTVGRSAMLFARIRRWLDRVAGAAFVGFGLHWMLDSRRP
jgi:threonine/homoserine/homoserine lactone efflux protein